MMNAMLVIILKMSEHFWRFIVRDSLEKRISLVRRVILIKRITVLRGRTSLLGKLELVRWYYSWLEKWRIWRKGRVLIWIGWIHIYNIICF